MVSSALYELYGKTLVEKELLENQLNKIREEINKGLLNTTPPSEPTPPTDAPAPSVIPEDNTTLDSIPATS